MTNVWIAKYRPQTLDTYVGNDAMKATFAKYIESNDLPHILLVGPPGTGKTTAAKILINSIECDSMIINASDDNNIDTVRSTIRGFASTAGWNPIKIMVLDEFDGFTRQGQEALRNLMEQFIDTTRFILTANYKERVIPPIISRVQDFRVEPPSVKQVFMYAANILTAENIEFAGADLKLLVEAHYPDIRKVIGEAQLASSTGQLVINQEEIVDSNFRLKLLAALKAKQDVMNKMTAVRQLLADAQLRDYIPVYRLLFENVTDYAPASSIPTVILALAEGQYRDALVIDKEINMVATLINVIEAI